VITEPKKKRESSSLRTWIKAALLTGAIMAALWLLLLKAPFLLFNYDPLVRAIAYLLTIPGAIVAVPSILVKGHNFWSGWMVAGAILNWLLYAQLLYLFLRWRQRKRNGVMRSDHAA